MKNRLIKIILAAVTLVILALPAFAEELKMVGTVSKITVSADKKSAVVVLKDVKSGEEVNINVTDELTLDKFADKRIVEGDEIRCRYDKDNGNLSRFFRKTAGC